MMQSSRVVQLLGKSLAAAALMGGAVLCPATVTVVGAEGQVRVLLAGSAVELRPAVVMRPLPVLVDGDQVLVAVDDDGAGYVIGVIHAAADHGERERARIEAKSGASAELVVVDGREQLELRDSAACLLVRHDGETGRTTLICERGALAFSAPEGDIELSAGGEVRVKGDAGVQIASGRAAFSLRGALASLSSAALSVTAQRADLGVRDLAYAGERLRARLSDSKLVLDRVETIATQLTERCKEAIREVEGLSQLRAGRMRSLIKDGLFVRAGHASIEAEEDMKIDGQRVHLG